jgi:pimeloyl-ACP methyl ester carboxylesterase
MTAQFPWKRWLKRIATAAVLLIVAFAVVGSSYEAISERSDRERFPQQGKSVDVGGFSLNINCTGQGSPTVILESGLGTVSVPGWEPVQADVSKFTRVCSYDRAGYGWSDPGPKPRTAIEIARELHALLQNDHIAPPYVLVGHSLGGMFVRVYCGLYPSEVVGMVLVDSTQEDEWSHYPPSMRAVAQKQLNQLKLRDQIDPLLIDLGIARIMASRGEPANEVLYLQLQSKYLDAVVSELESIDESALETRASGNLGDRPLIVLTAGQAMPEPGVPARDAEAFERMWVDEFQPSLAKLSTRGKRIMVENSNHLIALMQPKIVANAIEEVLVDTKQNSTLRQMAKGK